MVSLICFACPGIFNSLNALGGAGQSDPTVANNTNTGMCILMKFFDLHMSWRKRVVCLRLFYNGRVE
jgi:hypothetical protein